ncbi:MAG: ABC transporter ATP-binding protein [Sulfolobaceae archaeon]|nr:ABC transporter ATP-binding protein [Sulfolobaceae archaeon]
MSTETAISVTDLKKKFGNKEVLKGITFSVRRGSVYGLIGPNGAGKTTTLRILAGIIKNYSGQVLIEGLNPEKAREKGMIAYMPEDTFPYDRLTGIENLELYAEIYARGDKKLAEEYLELGIKIANLGKRIYDKAGEYSRGMKRRLIIARTLMVKPKVAILDEPTSALDVESALNIRDIIVKMSRELETTIVLSSHNMLEVEYMCDDISLINDGKIVASGTPRKIVEMFEARNLEEAFIKASKIGEKEK